MLFERGFSQASARSVTPDELTKGVTLSVLFSAGLAELSAACCDIGCHS